MHRRTTGRNRTLLPVATAALAAVFALGGCAGDDALGPGDSELHLELEGWLEASGTAQLRARLGSAWVPAGSVTWEIQPPGAVEWIDAELVRFLAEGQVTVRATAGAQTASRSVPIRGAAAIVFDMRRDGSRDLYAMGLDGGRLQRLTDHGADDLAPTAVGGRVVFTSYREGDAALYALDLEGGTIGRVSASGAREFDASLSPDGSRLAFARSQGGLAKIFVADGDGSDPTPVTASFGASGSYENSPAWAPAGDRLAFMSTTRGTADLFLLELGGDVSELVAQEGAAVLQPAWSPDGSAVAFASDHEGQLDLYLVHMATGDLRRLTDRAGADAQPAWLPDGRLVYVAYTEDGTDRELRWLDPSRPARSFKIPISGGEADPQNPAGVF